MKILNYFSWCFLFICLSSSASFIASSDTKFVPGKRERSRSPINDGDELSQIRRRLTFSNLGQKQGAAEIIRLALTRPNSAALPRFNRLLASLRNELTLEAVMNGMDLSPSAARNHTEEQAETVREEFVLLIEYVPVIEPIAQFALYLYNTQRSQTSRNEQTLSEIKAVLAALQGAAEQNLVSFFNFLCIYYNLRAWLATIAEFEEGKYQGSNIDELRQIAPMIERGVSNMFLAATDRKHDVILQSIKTHELEIFIKDFIKKNPSDPLADELSEALDALKI